MVEMEFLLMAIGHNFRKMAAKTAVLMKRALKTTSSYSEYNCITRICVIIDSEKLNFTSHKHFHILAA